MEWFQQLITCLHTFLLFSLSLSLSHHPLHLSIAHLLERYFMLILFLHIIYYLCHLLSHLSSTSHFSLSLLRHTPPPYTLTTETLCILEDIDRNSFLQSKNIYYVQLLQHAHKDTPLLQSHSRPES